MFVIYHASSLGPCALLLPLLFVLHFLGFLRVSAAGYTPNNRLARNRLKNVCA